MKTLTETELKTFLGQIKTSYPNLIESFIDSISDGETVFIQQAHKEMDAQLFEASFVVSNLSPKTAEFSDKTLTVGQLVTIVNDYGFPEPNMKIMGFCADGDATSVYVNTSNFNKPISHERIYVQDGWIGITDEQVKRIDADVINHFKPDHYDTLISLKSDIDSISLKEVPSEELMRRLDLLPPYNLICEQGFMSFTYMEPLDSHLYTSYIQIGDRSFSYISSEYLPMTYAEKLCRYILKLEEENKKVAA